jgi:hypothetical protein
MAQFVAINPNVEVNGQTVLSLVNGLGPFRTKGIEILKECGISNIKLDNWYSQQAWLNAFKHISKNTGSSTLLLIGKSIPDNAQFPSEIDDIFKALSSIDIAYHMNHRLDGKTLFDKQTGSMTEGIGHYHYKKVSNNEIEIKCDNPYPCDFDKGIVMQMANRFRPSNARAKIVHDESGCRKNGDESCIYRVTW